MRAANTFCPSLTGRRRQPAARLAAAGSGGSVLHTGLPLPSSAERPPPAPWGRHGRLSRPSQRSFPSSLTKYTRQIALFEAISTALALWWWLGSAAERDSHRRCLPCPVAPVGRRFGRAGQVRNATCTIDPQRGPGYGAIIRPWSRKGCVHSKYDERERPPTRPFLCHLAQGSPVGWPAFPAGGRAGHPTGLPVLRRLGGKDFPLCALISGKRASAL